MKRGASGNLRRRAVGGSPRIVARAGSCLLVEDGELLHLAQGRPREPIIVAIVIAATALFYLVLRATTLASADEATRAIPGLAVAALLLLASVAFVARSSRATRHQRRTLVTLDLGRGRLLGPDGEKLARLDDVRFSTHWNPLTRFETLRCSYDGDHLTVASVHRSLTSPFGWICRELVRRGVAA